MNELERYKHNPPFNVSSEDIERLVNNCTERAIERNCGQRATRSPMMRWVAVAAMVAIVVGLTWMLTNGYSTNSTIQQSPGTIAENHVTPVADTASDIKAVTVETIRQHVDNDAHVMPLTTAHHQPNTDTEVADDNMDEIDVVLSQMTQSELNMLDDGYCIDEIPEY